MLAIVLKILSIVGIVLLLVLAFVLLLLLLILFFPITYRVRGSKDEDGFGLTARVNWFFGLFRVRFGYPEPGRLTAKVLCFTLFDMRIPPEKGEPVQTGQGEPKADRAARETPLEKRFFGKKAKKAKTPADTGLPPRERHPSEEEAPQEERLPATSESAASAAESSQAHAPDSQAENGAPGAVPEDNSGLPGKILQKFQKIKYTIHHIYDKIKEIWDNISYYLRLLQEENTKQLAAHALRRVGSILKSIRPRRMAVELFFGMETPDTTGYLYGLYCVLSTALGPEFKVTPDFEQKRLEAKFDIAGHVIVWVFVINGLKLLLDRKLHLFLKKIKAGLKKPEKAAA